VATDLLAKALAFEDAAETRLVIVTRHAKYHGRTLALAVEAALQTLPKPLRGPLGLALEDVTLDFAPVPPREELEQTAATGREPDAAHANRRPIKPSP
jgi:hypothetical protein